MVSDEIDKKEEGQKAPPRGQIIFDNILLWFIISLALSFILYNGWGLIELLLVPPAP